MRLLWLYLGLALLLCLLMTLGSRWESPSFAQSESREARRARILAPATHFDSPERFERLQGGSGSNLTRLGRDAFSQPDGNLSFEQRADFFIGNGIFDRPWVPAPSSTIASDGLGPLLNARSCQGCHIKDGRGHPPMPGDRNFVSMLFVLADTEGNPDPVYGRQLQDQAIVGFEAEGQPRVIYEDYPVTYPDGTRLVLRKPRYGVEGLRHGPLAPTTALLPRVAPQMIGLGLIESIAAEDILAGSDPDDLDQDGISGRPHWVPSLWLGSEAELGRFGWKATSATLYDQSAVAFFNDMGLSTSLILPGYGDCTSAQRDCREAQHGGALPGEPEIDDTLLDLVTFYAGTLAVPGRRNFDDPDVLAGKALFYRSQCTACHTPKFATSADAPEALRNQLIWPYSDFLLHDMGPELADASPTGDASPAEWRTPPLWGLGYTEAVSGHSFLLHDGRARSIEEAILWHGGEASAARAAFMALSARERAQLIAFLESL